MAAPAIQTYTNAGKMKIYMDFCPNYVSYNLYYSTSASFTYSTGTLIGNFLNGIDGMYSKKHTMYQFTRPVPENTEFYMLLIGVPSSGSPDVGNPGPTKFMPAVSENLPLYKPVQIEGLDKNGVYRPVEVTIAGAIVTSATP